MRETERVLSEQEELFLTYLETCSTIKEAALLAGLSPDTGYTYAKKLKDVIIDRARDKLAVSSLKAASLTANLMDADASTEKGELRLKAAESILDRTGVTRHTAVTVSMENENGIFILPGKAPIPPRPPEDTPEYTGEDDTEEQGEN